MQFLHEEVWPCGALFCAITLRPWGLGGGGICCLSSNWRKRPLKSTETAFGVKHTDGFDQEKKLCWCLQMKEASGRGLTTQLFFVVIWEKSVRLTYRWKGKHVTAALSHYNRIWLAVSLETPVTSLMKGRKLCLGAHQPPKATPVTCSAGYDGSVSLCRERQRYLITLLTDPGKWVTSLPSAEYLVVFFFF